MNKSIFITGANGFVGRALVPRFLASSGRSVILLVRRALDGDSFDKTRCRIVIGDLLDASSYASALGECNTVIHLAAATGRATADEFERVNVDGTRALVEASQQANVGRFLHVSTIAAGYRDQHFSAYAKTKKEAEEIVENSGLTFSILRPTIVLGEKSPIWLTLKKITALPVVPLLEGKNPVLVQPIHVDDVVRGILRIIESDQFRNEILELGGPNPLSLASFLSLIQMTRSGKSKIVSLPLAPIRMLLASAEPLAHAALPVTAGQLTVFANDSTAAANWLTDELRATMPTIEQTIARLIDTSTPTDRNDRTVSQGGSSVAVARPLTDAGKRTIDSECVLFSNYLVGVTPTDYVKIQYRKALLARGFAFDADFSPFDRATLGVARTGRLWTRCADAYSALFHRTGALRCKLIILAAILEHAPPASEFFDGRGAHARLRTLGALATNGAAFVFSAALGAALLIPLGLFSLIRRSRASA